jgi:hypothetical protein
MKALNPFAPFWYTPLGDREAPEGQRTRFKIKGLDGVEAGYVLPEVRFAEDGRMVGLSGKGVELALGYAMVDWENFANDSGPLAFARANFHLIPVELRAELALHILGASFPSAEEKKT